jgi:hypothetical protein
VSRFALTTNVRKLQIEVSEASTTNPVAVTVSYIQWRTTELPVYGNENTTISTTSVTDISSVAPSSIPKLVTMINVYNQDTIDHTIALYYYDNGTRYIIWKGIIKSGSTLTQSGTGGGMVVSSDGSAQWSTGSTGSIHYTAILLNHFDGVDGSTTFTDEVPGVSWFLGGSTQIDTAQSKFGVSSALLPGTDFAYANGFTIPKASDFTAELFIRAESGAKPRIWLTNVFDDTRVKVTRVSATEIQWDLITDVIGDGFINRSVTVTWANDTWYHLAVTHDSTLNEFNLYFNGTRIDQWLSSADLEGNVTKFHLISDPTATNNNWRDEARIVLAVVYTGTSYTVPTAPFDP